MQSRERFSKRYRLDKAVADPFAKSFSVSLVSICNEKSNLVKKKKKSERIIEIEREEEEEEKGETFELEGVEPESLVSKVLETLEMAFPNIWGVLEFLVAVVAVVLPQRHSLSLSLSLSLYACVSSPILGSVACRFVAGQ